MPSPFKIKGNLYDFRHDGERAVTCNECGTKLPACELLVNRSYVAHCPQCGSTDLLMPDQEYTVHVESQATIVVPFTLTAPSKMLAESRALAEFNRASPADVQNRLSELRRKMGRVISVTPEASNDREE